MSYNKYNDYEVVDGVGQVTKTDVSAFMSKIFSYMFLALLASGLTAYVVGTSPELMSKLMSFEDGRAVRTGLGWVVMLAPLGLVIYMGTRMQKMSYSSLLIAFFAFSILFGASVSYIFMYYTSGHLFLTFFVSAATFGVMAVVGYTTSTDLTKMGSLLYMALIGLIIAMIANWFMQSSQMGYIISGIGVLIFTGLTAYDTQKLKNMALTLGTQSDMAKKMIIMGALTLYLDFVNLFLFMLRFMGGRS